MTGGYPSGRKEYCHPYGWLRKADCELAEKVMGFIWIDVGDKKDCCGNPFTHILTRPELTYKTHVLEPDTRVPNYTTEIFDFFEVVEALGIESVPVSALRKDHAHEWSLTIIENWRNK